MLTAAAEHGLAPLCGSSGHVGVMGYLTGGGLPLACRTYGFSADYVRSLDIVTADGLLRTVSPTPEPDLFWAVRGGKSNFGVVVAAEIDELPWWLTRGEAEQERGTALREQTLGSAPAIWTFILLIALTIPLLIAG
ncbi:hypothetical protein FHR32_007984 [Streptosporangium album]|uniref:FAD-binding PCMH-type domain-containing protein n=1 Tax=Streptosporangium album TaxID=47479 RepID=A0A7W7S465_9ACTN|nr:FAD-binding protein [Streptosporangium album]MBB4943584.1 hypothetical protein [Streptosporangium album]